MLLSLKLLRAKVYTLLLDIVLIVLWLYWPIEDNVHTYHFQYHLLCFLVDGACLDKEFIIETFIDVDNKGNGYQP